MKYEIVELLGVEANSVVRSRLKKIYVINYLLDIDYKHLI